MENEKFVLGIDYGTDSVRAVLVDAMTGSEITSAVAYYPRWAEGRYCDPSKSMFRQHPLDYVEGLETAVKQALAGLPGAGEKVAGIGIDTTGSTPCATDAAGRPLALTEAFKDNPNAMFVLWKDHTGVAEAEEINHYARTWGGTDYTKYEGGIYSAEWFWSKILHVLRADPQIRNAAHSWAEHCDWLPALLTGTEAGVKRSRCAAGHKAMWHEEWGGLPPERFLEGLDPVLKGLRDRLYTATYTSDQKAGGLTTSWAARLGLRPGTAVAVGAFDAHMGAVGGQITPSALVKIMGTSTCDVMVAPYEVIGKKLIKGICGQVDGSVIPGMIGLEAGQSAYGDVYAWFKRMLSWPLEELTETSMIDRATGEKLRQQIEDGILRKLSEEAARIPCQETHLVALDWLNGRRTPDADQTLKGAILGLTLGATAPEVYRALVEATAFGARAIADRFRAEGVAIDQVIALGGIAKKNEFVMQVASDVMNMPIKVVSSDQACALGAAMFGAVAAGVYGDIQEAQTRMGGGFSQTFMPGLERAREYQKLYGDYLRFGTEIAGHLRDL